MTSDLNQKLDSTLLSLRRAVAMGIVDAAGEIRRVSVQRTPVDTGFLRKSAEVYVDGAASSAPHPTAHTREVAVRYSAPYAAHVHNASGRGRGRPRQPPHRGKYWDPSGSEPKFLEKAADEVFPRLEKFVLRRVQEALRDGY